MTGQPTDPSPASSAVLYPDSIPPPRYSTNPVTPNNNTTAPAGLGGLQGGNAGGQGGEEGNGSAAEASFGSGGPSGGGSAGVPISTGEEGASEGVPSSLPNPSPATGFPVLMASGTQPEPTPSRYEYTPTPYGGPAQHPVGVPPYMGMPGQQPMMGGPTGPGPAPGAYPGAYPGGQYPGVRLPPPADTRVKVTREGGGVTVAVPGAGWGPTGSGQSAGGELISAIVLIVLGCIFPILLVVFPVFFLALFCIPFLILGLLALASSFRTALLKEELSLREGRFTVAKNFLGWKKKVQGPVSSIAFLYVRLKQRYTTDTVTGMYRQKPPSSLVVIQQGVQEIGFGEFLSYAEHEFIVSEMAASGLPARPPQWESYSIY